EVFRSPGSLILWWLWTVFAAVTLIDLIVQGTGRSAVTMAVLVVAITALVYGCALRPRIVADAGGITVENPLRDHRVPWGARGGGEEQGRGAQGAGGRGGAHRGPGRGKPTVAGPAQPPPRPPGAAEPGSRRQARRMGQPPGYGRYPAEAQAALRRSPAEAT